MRYHFQNSCIDFLSALIRKRAFSRTFRRFPSLLEEAVVGVTVASKAILTDIIVV